MASLSPPQSPQYRITLFYGPEPVEGHPTVQQCVFNVKKRSWKAGVQIAVEITEEQRARAAATLGFAGWLETVLAGVNAGERTTYAQRAHELLAQSLAALKLEAAIDSGLAQANGRLGSAMLAEELDRRVTGRGDDIKSQILTELDLPVP